MLPFHVILYLYTYDYRKQNICPLVSCCCFRERAGLGTHPLQRGCWVQPQMHTSNSLHKQDCLWAYCSAWTRPCFSIFIYWKMQVVVLASWNDEVFTSFLFFHLLRNSQTLLALSGEVNYWGNSFSPFLLLLSCPQKWEMKSYLLR